MYGIDLNIRDEDKCVQRKSCRKLSCVVCSEIRNLRKTYIDIINCDHSDIILDFHYKKIETRICARINSLKSKRDETHKAKSRFYIVNKVYWDIGIIGERDEPRSTTLC